MLQSSQTSISYETERIRGARPHRRLGITGSPLREVAGITLSYLQAHSGHQWHPIVFKQAEKIIEKFGGPAKLANALQCDAATIYKWTYPKDKGGTDGLIPSSTMPAVLKAADILGIDLSSEDIDPREETHA